MVNAARGMIARRRRARKKAVVVETTAVASGEEEEEEESAGVGATDLGEGEVRVENGDHRISEDSEGVDRMSGTTFMEVRMNGALGDHLVEEEVIDGTDGEHNAGKKYGKLRCVIDGEDNIGGREMLLVAEDVGDGIGECLVMVDGDDECMGAEVWEEGFVEEEVVSEETVVYEEEVVTPEVCEGTASHDATGYTDHGDILDYGDVELEENVQDKFSANGEVLESWSGVNHSSHPEVSELIEEVAGLEVEVGVAKEGVEMVVAAEEEVVGESDEGNQSEGEERVSYRKQSPMVCLGSEEEEKDNNNEMIDTAIIASPTEDCLPEIGVKDSECASLVRDSSTGEEDGEDCDIAKSAPRTRAGSTDTSCSSDDLHGTSLTAEEPPFGLLEPDYEDLGIRRRRSSRIRSLLVSGKRCMGTTVSAMKSEAALEECGSVKNSSVVSYNSVSSQETVSAVRRSASPTDVPMASLPLPKPPQPSPPLSFQDSSKPVKVKSRWRRSSELEMGGGRTSDSEMRTTPPPSISPRLGVPPPPSSYSSALVLPAQPSPESCSLPSSHQTPSTSAAPSPSSTLCRADGEQKKGSSEGKSEKREREMEERLRNFDIVDENIYLTDRTRSKEAKRMVCDCMLTKEEQIRGEPGCGEDCLNRLLMIECGSRCPVGDCCTNKRFQKKEYAKTEIFRTEKKGFGLRALQDMPVGTFVMEYVGEVLDPKEFRRRAKDYARERNRHYYFMALKSDTIIDATLKGNTSRFINHSCEPNAETQKWTVNGELRIGFFSKDFIPCGDEITFDYQLQRYGKEAQRCYCEKPSCRGWIGEDPEKAKRGSVSSSRSSSSGFAREKKEKEAAAAAAARVKRREEKRKDPKEFFQDMDLEEEIEKLCASGLKNRAHTLTLCRLMVRAEERGARSRLLALLREGEQACRRLFLDYHGLRLVWSWMIDMGGGVSCSAMDWEDTLSLRFEILETLAQLPIPNKTMLQDSKVLSAVQRWLSRPLPALLTPSSTPSPSPSTSPLSQQNSTINGKEQVRAKEKLPVVEEGIPNDLEALRPKGDVDEKVGEGQTTLALENEKQVVDAEGSKREGEEKKGKEGGWQKSSSRRKVCEEGEEEDGGGIEEEDEEEEEEEEEGGGRKGAEEALAVTAKVEDREERQRMLSEIVSSLLDGWSSLKEVFRIPKKERIEQMKEHEREADRGYKEYLDKEGHHNKQSYDRHWRQDRFRGGDSKRERKRGRGSVDSTGSDRPAKKKPLLGDRNSHMSKAERRHLFAMKVQQEEQEKQRRQEQMWQQQQQMQQAAITFSDANLAPTMYDPVTGYPLYYDPVSNSWVPYPQMPQQQPPALIPIPTQPIMPHTDPNGMGPHPELGGYEPLLPSPSPHHFLQPSTANQTQPQQSPLLPTPLQPLPPPSQPLLPLPQSPITANSHQPVQSPLLPTPQMPPLLPTPSPLLPTPQSSPLLPTPPQHPMPSPLLPHPPHSHPIPHQPQLSPHLPPNQPQILPPPVIPHQPLPPPQPPLPHILPGPHQPLPQSQSIIRPPLPHPPPPLPIPPQKVYEHSGRSTPSSLSPLDIPLPPGGPPQHPQSSPSVSPQMAPAPEFIPLPSQPPPPQYSSNPSSTTQPVFTRAVHHPMEAPLPHGNPPNFTPSEQQHVPVSNVGQSVSQSAPAAPQAPAVVTTPAQASTSDQITRLPYPLGVVGGAYNPPPPPPPPPVQLPPKWKAAKDAEGRTYYYHIKLRVPQWEPPVWPQEPEEAASKVPSIVEEVEEEEEVSEEDEEEEEEEEEGEEEGEEGEGEVSEEEEEEEEEEEAPAYEEGASSTEDEDEMEEQEEEGDEVIEGSHSSEAHYEVDMIHRKVGAAQDRLMVGEEGWKVEGASTEEDPRQRRRRKMMAMVASSAAKREQRERRREGLVQERIISPRRESGHSESEKVYRQIKDRLRRHKMAREAASAASKQGSSMGIPSTVIPPSSSIASSQRHHGNHRHHHRHHHRRPTSPNSASSSSATTTLPRLDDDGGEEGDLERSLRQMEEGDLEREEPMEGDDHEGTVVAGADTSSSDMARRIKDNFRVNMAGVIVSCLNQHRRPDCKNGRIVNTEDFKHLARKLTHFVMLKELKHCRSVGDLECNENVKHKARDFVRKYMLKFGAVYKRPTSDREEH